MYAVKHVAAAFDAWRRTRGVATTTPSLVRIAVWVCLFLLLPRLLWEDGGGYNPPAPDAHCVRMRSLMGDPRGFRGPFPREEGVDFRMAWIAGSASFIYRPEEDVDLLPRRVALALPHEGPRQVQALSYVNAATRLYDRYLCLQDALQRDVDVIVLALTPKYLTEPRSAAHMRYQYPAAVTRLPGARDHWGTYLAMSQPSDWLQGAAMAGFPTVRDQADFHRYPRALARLLHPLEKTPGAAAEVSHAWAEAHTPVPWTAHPAAFVRRKVGEYPAPAGGLEADARHDLNVWILEAMLAQLAAWEGAALVFLEPLAPGADAPGVGASVDLVAEMAARYKRPGLCIISEIPESWTAGAHFKDEIHLAEPAPGVDGAGVYPAALAAAVWETYGAVP